MVGTLDLETFLQTDILGLFAFIAVLASVIPALVLRWAMRVLFQLDLAYLPILAVLVVSQLALVAVVVWLGLFEAAMRESVPLVPAALIWFAGLATQLALLTVFVPDEYGQLVAMWKWLAGLVLQWVVYLFVSLALGLLAVAVMLASAPN